MRKDAQITVRLAEHPEVFDARFARCRRLLGLIAGRVLGGGDGVKDAVGRCWLTASRNPPRFAHEGAFRSWLVRILINEALSVLRESRTRIGGSSAPKNSTRIRERGCLHGVIAANRPQGHRSGRPGTAEDGCRLGGVVAVS